MDPDAFWRLLAWACGDLTTDADLPFTPNPYPKMTDISISAVCFVKLFKCLNSFKAADPGILHIVLQTTHKELPPPPPPYLWIRENSPNFLVVMVGPHYCF